MSVVVIHFAYSERIASSSIADLVELFGMIFGSNVRLPVSGSGQFKEPEVALESFLAVSVPGVSDGASFASTIEVEIHLSIKDTFEQSLVNLSDDALFAP